MKKTYSPYFDRLFRRAVKEGRPELIHGARNNEVQVIGLVSNPDCLQEYWDRGMAGDEEALGVLAYVAEYIRHGIDPVISKTDPAQFGMLTRGLARLKAMGWEQRLKPGPLRCRAAAARKRHARIRPPEYRVDDRKLFPTFDS